MASTDLAHPPEPQRLRVNPAVPARIGFAAIVLFVAALVLWGTLAPVSGAAIAEGKLQVEGRRQTVQHPYGGVVERMMVRDGQKVTKGQVLFTLSDTEPRARLGVLMAERDARLAQAQRLIAERDERRDPGFTKELVDRASEPSVAQAMANERALMTSRWRQFETETGVQRQTLAGLTEKVDGLKAQLDGIERQHQLVEEEAEGSRSLLAKGLTPKTRVLALEREIARLLADAGAKRSEIANAREGIKGAELEIARLERQRVNEITGELRDVQAKLVELNPKLDAARDVLARTMITAPATGAVVGLSVFTEGGVVQPGAKMLDVVPSGDPLIAEAELRLTDVNEVKTGQTADVRLTSFTRNERPTISGEVLTVSADRLTDERSGEGYYAVQIRLDPADVDKANVELSAGMPAEIIVTTRPRTLIDYLVGPMVDEITGAFRER